MTKKKTKLFGDKFNIWDVLLIFLIFGSGFYLIESFSLEELLTKIASTIFILTFVSLIYKKVRRKARK